MLKTLIKNISKHSATILVYTGIVGSIASTVMLCKKTVDTKKDIETTKQICENIESTNTPEESSKKIQEEQKKLFIRTALNYAPYVAAYVTSIGLILISKKIVDKRLTIISSAYGTLQTAYNKYKKNIIEKYGEEVDFEIRNNIKTEKVRNGKKIETIKYTEEPSVYSKFFDETCENYRKDAEYNLFFLKQTEKFCNVKLQSQGYLFLNEVYKALGLPATKAGQVVGWVYDNENKYGDNFVDFGIYNINRDKNRDFVNGHEKAILLDFNVYGNILDFM